MSLDWQIGYSQLDVIHRLHCYTYFMHSPKVDVILRWTSWCSFTVLNTFLSVVICRLLMNWLDAQLIHCRSVCSSIIYCFNLLVESKLLLCWWEYLFIVGIEFSIWCFMHLLLQVCLCVCVCVCVCMYVCAHTYTSALYVTVNIDADTTVFLFLFCYMK